LNYYNEYDPFAVAWLRELIKDGLIPDGRVDKRSIIDVTPEDLKGFTQCHFFCGIGGWSRALQIAGWNSDRPVWTGSPPCQPFSTAGNKKGKDDLRHLWPVFFNLIRECKPPTIFGEQVASAIRFGWLDDLQSDLEAEGYAAAAVVLPSGGVGSPHKRDRLFFTAKRVGNSSGSTSERQLGAVSGAQEKVGGEGTQHGHFSIGHSNASQVDRCKFVADPKSGGRKQEQSDIRRGRTGVGTPEHEARGLESSDTVSDSSVGDAEHTGSHGVEVRRSPAQASNDRQEGENFPEQPEGASRSEESGDIRFWKDTATIHCRDGKYRPIPTEPALFPLANGVSNRVGILRGAGNAIVPQAAAEIIKAFM
jgi:DNA (cytosine-5)-methyltransferase 1